MQMLFGKSISRALSVIADLCIADHIGQGPTAVAELAEKSGAHEDALYRSLRCLAAVGVFTESPDRKFSNNDVSKLLISDAEKSMRQMVRWVNTKPAWDAWGRLDHSVKTGEPAFDEVFGTNVFEHFKKDKETAAIFHDAMTGFSGMTAHAVAEGYDFSGCKKLWTSAAATALCSARSWRTIRT